MPLQLDLDAVFTLVRGALPRMTSVGLLLAAAVASASPAQSQLSRGGVDSLRTELQRAFDNLRSSSLFPGGTFAVVLPDGQVVTVATGLSDSAKKIAMTPTSLMPQGSVGKTYVSAIAMRLIAENKLDLSAPVSRYLGDEQWLARLPNSARITVRHLMNHSSGLVRYEFNPRFTSDLTSAPPDRIWPPRELIAYLLDSTAPFAPGEGWEYSDTNYLALGLIMEKITGTPLFTEIKNKIVEPLMLRATLPNDSRTVPGISQGYAGPRNPFGGRDEMLLDGQFGFNPQFEWAGGGWSSTSADLARWGKALYEWRIFPESLKSIFLDGVPSNLGRDVRYGLGVIIWPAPTSAPTLGQAWGHSGFFPGYQTELRYYPDLKLSAAIQVNSSVGRAVTGGLARAINDLSAIAAAAIAAARLPAH